MNWNASGQGTIAVTVPDRGALLDDVRARLQDGQGFSVATLNLDHVVKLARDPKFRDAYRQQTHITADGKPIVWLARLAGQRDVSLVPGSELIDPLCDLAAAHNVSVALYGATEATLEQAARKLQERYPGLSIALCRAPEMGFDPVSRSASEDLAAIEASGAKLCFLALGAPKQEILAARARHVAPNVGFVSIGAGLDFIAGSQTRAPAWARAIAAEWLWRLMGNPKRLAGRYAACLAILPALTVRALRIRRKGRPVQ